MKNSEIKKIAKVIENIEIRIAKLYIDLAHCSDNQVGDIAKRIKKARTYKFELESIIKNG